MPRATVRTWMTPHPITISPKESVLTAYSRMKQHRIRRLPVLDDSAGLTGILTLNDIRSTAPLGDLVWLEHNHLLTHMPVERIMSANPITIHPDKHISEAARLMMKHKIGGLPVVENDQIIGVISEADIFRYTIAEGWSPGQQDPETTGVEHVTLPDGFTVCIRPITPEDKPRLQTAHEKLSRQTVYDRFMGFRMALPEDEARYLTGLDYDSHMALVATIHVDGDEEIVGVARYIQIDNQPGTAEFAVVISDGFQRRGLGSRLMRRLADYAADHGVTTLLGITHPDNYRFLRFVQQLGLPVELQKEDGLWEVRLRLKVQSLIPA